MHMFVCIHNIGKAILQDGVHALCVCAPTNVLYVYYAHIYVIR